MRTSSAATRARILKAAYALFYAKGYSRVGVDAVAASAGLTKRTLYYHFSSKDELLSAVLDHQGELALARIERWGSRLTTDRDGFIASLFDDAARWASKPGWAGAGFTRLVMELADLSGHPARAIARRHKAAVESWLAAELGKRGVKDAARAAREMVILLEGCLVLMLIHGSRDYVSAAAGAARELVDCRGNDDESRGSAAS